MDRSVVQPNASRPVAAEDKDVTVLAGMCWGFGALGANALIPVFTGVALYYLIYIVKIDMGLATTAIFLARMSDLVFAPAVGVISDRTETRWGGRRPYLLVASALAPASCLLVFNNPFKGDIAVAWAIISMLLYTFSYTMFNIPHMAMANDMTSNPRARVRLMSYKMVFATLGSLVGGSLIPYALQWFGEGVSAYRNVSILLAVICFSTMFTAFAGTPSPPVVARLRQKTTLAQLASAALGNVPFLSFTSGKFLALFLAGGQSPALIFFVRTVMKLPLSALSIYVLSMSAAALASAPLWFRIVRRYGNLHTCNLTFFIGMVASLSWMLAGPGEHFAWLMVRGALTGLVVGGFQLTRNTMAADIMELDAIRHGQRREGLFSAVFSFTEKTAAALGVLVIGLLLSALGFNSKLAPTGTQSDNVNIGLYLAMSILPALGYLAAYLIFRFYRLGPAELQAARETAAAARPA